MASASIRASIHEAAASWFARQQAGALDDAQRLEFAAWLSQSPEHEQAWRAVQGAWQALGAMGSSPAIRDWRRSALAAGTSRRFHWGWAAAASVAVAVSALWMVRGSFDDAAPKSAVVVTFPSWTTVVGEQRTETLSDGSQVMLNTHSTVRVTEWGAVRQLSLDNGEAYFQVAKDDAKPFSVVAGQAVVTAIGTAFSVRKQGDAVIVVLTEGHVRLAEQQGASEVAGEAIEMRAGSQATYSANSTPRWQVQAADVRRMTSWREGRLAFDGEPLVEVVAELNRYSTQQLVVADESLKRTPISGVFRAGDNRAFARTLQDYGLADIQASDAQRLELQPRRAQPK